MLKKSLFLNLAVWGTWKIPPWKIVTHSQVPVPTSASDLKFNIPIICSKKLIPRNTVIKCHTSLKKIMSEMITCSNNFTVTGSNKNIPILKNRFRRTKPA